MGRKMRAWIALLLAAAASDAVPPARADEAPDHERARRAVEAGELRPLADILAEVRTRLPGEVVRTEIERRKGRWMYEFRVIDAQGRVFEVYVDGKSAAVERIKEK